MNPMNDLTRRINDMSASTDVFRIALNGLDDEAADEPSLLPGWQRRHVIAHVAANADALHNLVDWARTGEPTPMYASAEDRERDIEIGAKLDMDSLRERVEDSAIALETAIRVLPSARWSTEIRTATGRALPATVVPWLRTREVVVHAVDLGVGIGFDSFPVGLLHELIDDVVLHRSKAPGDHPALRLIAEKGQWVLPGEGRQVTVRGTLPELAAYVCGRAQASLSAPTLPRWL